MRGFIGVLGCMAKAELSGRNRRVITVVLYALKMTINFLSEGEATPPCSPGQVHDISCKLIYVTDRLHNPPISWWLNSRTPRPPLCGVLYEKTLTLYEMPALTLHTQFAMHRITNRELLQVRHRASFKGQVN
jgi:hypothetical protein